MPAPKPLLLKYNLKSIEGVFPGAINPSHTQMHTAKPPVLHLAFIRVHQPEFVQHLPCLSDFLLDQAQGPDSQGFGEAYSYIATNDIACERSIV